MGCSVHSYRKLAVALLAATVVVGLTAGAILAQSNPLGAGASTQDEPIKRTVLFRGDLDSAPGKEIVVFVADLDRQRQLVWSWSLPSRQVWSVY